MFSVSNATLSILKHLHQDYSSNPPLYAITPAAGESARGMGAFGGVDGLVRTSVKQIISSKNFKAMSMGVYGGLTLKPDMLLCSFISLERSRIRTVAGKHANIKSVMLHEIVTDLALSLDLDWLFKSYIDFLIKEKIQPGFETRNFSYLINKFNSWNIDLSKVTIAAPFNKIGFLMLPSKEICEKTLASLPASNVIAISVLAAGYLKPREAAQYIRTQPNLSGVAIAVSKEQQAHETFKAFE